MNSQMQPLNILVIEDEPLIAMDLETMIEDAGHVVVGQAASLYDCEGWNDGLLPQLAFVDIQLAQGTNGLDVSQLIQRKWPETIIVFVTANPKIIPDDFGGAHGVISKPLSQNGFMAALRYLHEGVCNPPPVIAQPNSFRPSPAFEAAWKS